MNKLLRLGINPLSWTNDADHTLGDHISFETCIDDAARAGFSGIEVGRKFPRDPQFMCTALSNKGLVPVSCWYSGLLTERGVDAEWVETEPFVDWLISLGCEVLIYGECGLEAPGGQSAMLSHHPRISSSDLQRFALKLTALADRVTARGLRFAFHPHVMHPIETTAQIDDLMTATGPSVGLLLDTGHIEMSGGSYLDIMNRHWSRVQHLHLKDVRQNVLDAVDPKAMTLFDCVHAGIFTLPGDGDIDFEPLFKKIYAEGYDGWVVVEAEQDPLVAPPDLLSAKSFAYLASLVTSSGLSYERNPLHV